MCKKSSNGKNEKRAGGTSPLRPNLLLLIKINIQTLLKEIPLTILGLETHQTTFLVYQRKDQVMVNHTL